MDKNIRNVFYFYLILALILIVYLIKINICDKKEYITNSYNPRMKVSQDNIKRGDILDKDKNILAQSILTDDGFVREYNYEKEFAHVIGYIKNGGYGVERKYNFELQSLDNEVFQHLESFITGYIPRANSLVLTIDSELQKYAYSKLKNRKGAFVAIEPSTGKILSMVSNPSFNPNTLSKDLENLRLDDSSPLINRASQGLYPPGSIFKPIVYLSQIENNIDFQTECVGHITFDGYTINCFNSEAHGQVDAKKAIAKSCNSYFAQVGNMLGAESLIKTSEKFMFNKKLSYPLEYNISSFSLNKKDDEKKIAASSIGQGDTLVSPLHMALITSAIANNGIMMRPYILDSILNYNYKQIDKFYPKKITSVTTPQNAKIVAEAMREVVLNGTATDAVLSSSAIAGKTGTAENETGKDHSWFMAYAPYENPEIAAVLILENAGGSVRAVPILTDIINNYLNK